MNRRFPRPARRVNVTKSDAVTNINAQPEPVRNKTARPSSIFQHPWVLILLLAGVFASGIFSGFLIWGGNDPVETPTQSFTRTKVDEGNNPSIGPADAPITIIEFSDYQCPFCQRWQSQVYQKLLDAYPTQVRLVYRDLPLISIHPEAEPAAMAADCAGEQDAYFKYHDKLFSYEYDLGREAYLKYAGELNLDMTAFTRCLDNQRYKDEVQADYQYATNLGLGSTPTFFINGIKVVGAQSFETFKSIIDKELAGDLPK